MRGKRAKKKESVLGITATNLLKNIGMLFKIYENIGKIGGFSEYRIQTQNKGVL